MNQATTKQRCKGCNREIDECAFCDEPDCPAAMCDGCVNRELKQRLPQPHDHGG
jgi:hypothetical protein